MKKNCLIAIAIFTSMYSRGQGTQTPADSSSWKFGAEANLYFIPNDIFTLPIFRADKDKLHLEARYNYEDRQTFSGWVGYNLKGGKTWEYIFTPMIGGVAGLTNGIAPGVEFTLTRSRFELYMETEFLFDLGGKENSYYYNWTDLTYSVTDWLWLGISGQRTRLYKTDLDIQRGVLAGVGFKNWEVTGYLYNLGFDDPFGLLTLSFNF